MHDMKAIVRGLRHANKAIGKLLRAHDVECKHLFLDEQILSRMLCGPTDEPADIDPKKVESHYFEENPWVTAEPVARGEGERGEGASDGQGDEGPARIREGCARSRRRTRARLPSTFVSR